MKLFALTALTILSGVQNYMIHAQSVQLPTSCTTIDVRREWNDLTPGEQSRYTAAVNQLRVNGEYDKFVRMHMDQNSNWHLGAMFLPAHRLFIYQYEQALRAIDSSIVLPYWDWSINSTYWWQNFIWRRFGDAPPQQCINRDFTGFTVQNPDPHCVKRGVDFTGNQMGAFVATEVLGRMTSDATDSFAQFAQKVEYGGHATVHNELGLYRGPKPANLPYEGDMSYMFSPNDPIFFQHHGMVDKLWLNWQQSKASRFSEMNGKQNGVDLTLSSAIAPWGVSISNVMDPARLCYRYANPGEPRTNPSTSSVLPTSTSSSSLPTSSTSLSTSFTAVTSTSTATWSEPTYSSTSYATYSMSHFSASSSSYGIYTTKPSVGVEYTTPPSSVAFSVPTFRINAARRPNPLPLSFIKNMGYNETQVRMIEAELQSLYADVEETLSRGEFIPGPGVNFNLPIVSSVRGQSVFGGPDPYMKDLLCDPMLSFFNVTIGNTSDSYRPVFKVENNSIPESSATMITSGLFGLFISMFLSVLLI